MKAFWFRADAGACGKDMTAVDADELEALSFPSAMRPFLDFARIKLLAKEE